MIRSVTALLTVALLSGLVAPVAASAQEQAAQTHEVRRGDTLWSLAERYYDNGRLWRQIFEANRDRLDDPGDLQVGLVLTVPGRQAAAVRGVTVVTPGGAATEPEPAEPAGEPVAEAAEPLAMAGAEPQEARGPKPIGRRTVLYPDTTNPTFESDATPPLAAVSRDVVYASPWLVREGRSVERSGVLVRFAGAEGESSPRRSARPHDRVLIHFEGSPPSVGSLLQAFRPERRIAELGTVVEPTGVVRVESVEPAGVVAVVEKLYRRMALDDAVGPLPAYELSPGQHAEAVAEGAEVTVLGFAEPRPIYSVGDVLFLDLTAAGARVGDEYAVLIRSEEGWAGAAEGRLQVVGVRDDHAVARITAEESPLVGPGVRVRLDRRMR